jgi:hypothetical protein
MTTTTILPGRDAADDLVFYPAPAMYRSLSNPKRLQESLEEPTSAAAHSLLIHPVATTATERNGRFGHVG